MQPVGFEPTVSPIESLYDKIEELSPQTEAQRSLQAQALKVTTDLGHTRFLLFEQAGSSIPLPFLVVLVFWLAIIFASFGLNAPRNATVVGAFLVCSLSIGTSIFLIREMGSPFDGLLMISGEPMATALNHLSEPDGSEGRTPPSHPDLSALMPR